MVKLIAMPVGNLFKPEIKFIFKDVLGVEKTVTFFCDEYLAETKDVEEFFRVFREDLRSPENPR